MDALSIEESYKLLNVTPQSSDEEIAKSYRALALTYHPDKNRDKIEWATRIMSRINSAYTFIMSSRFRKAPTKEDEKQKPRTDTSQHIYEELRKRREEEAMQMRAEELKTEATISSFRVIREDAKEALYRFFQYSLYNIARRSMPQNSSTFNDIVRILKRAYHDIEKLVPTTTDKEVLEHLNVFQNMIFHFYRAAECLNVPDRYDNVLDIEAFRIYRQGEESLHQSHRELFYSRHNRGSFNMDQALRLADQAREFFKLTLQMYPDSTWTVETEIKLEYTEALIAYITLFFSED
ncbi:MAG TPA: J domain-containing protein [Spirochaetota bacterium]